MYRYAALIPIKDHSERVPGKNFRTLGPMPLWEHIVKTLSAIDAIEEIFIDTDSKRFTPERLAPYPKVRILPRPESLHGDFVSTNMIFEYDLTQIPNEYTHFVQTHTTNPLLSVETILNGVVAYEKAIESGEYDSLFTVTAFFGRFFNRSGAALNHNPNELIRTQDLDPMLMENSNLYCFSRKAFAKRRARIGERPFMFEMDPKEAVDIDDQQSWDMAEALIAAAE